MRDFEEGRGQKQGIMGKKTQKGQRKEIKGRREARREQSGREKKKKSKGESIGTGAGMAYRRREIMGKEKPGEAEGGK